MRARKKAALELVVMALVKVTAPVLFVNTKYGLQTQSLSNGRIGLAGFQADDDSRLGFLGRIILLQGASVPLASTAGLNPAKPEGATLLAIELEHWIGQHCSRPWPPSFLPVGNAKLCKTPGRSSAPPLPACQTVRL